MRLIEEALTVAQVINLHGWRGAPKTRKKNIVRVDILRVSA